MKQPFFCSGLGAYYSTSPDAKDPKPHYLRITLPDIMAMVKNPLRVAKEKAQWAIFSEYMSRVHSEQRERGLYGCLWLECDKADGLTWDDVIRKVQDVCSEFIIYTSRSATESNPKFHVLIPLEKPVDGKTYCILQKIINDKLESAGLLPDRASERPGQLCYLPNRGEFYKYHVQDVYGPVNAEEYWKPEIQAEREREAAEEKARAERMEQARLKTAERVANGSESAIEAFNNYYNLEDVLLHYGYIKIGNRFISPNSESQNPGVSILE